MIRRPIETPLRVGLTWNERWLNADRGLIHCWELGRRLRAADQRIAQRAEKGEFPPLHWKGGFNGQLKAEKRYATLQYLAMWQGLANLDLVIAPNAEVTMVCSRTNVTVIFTADINKFGCEKSGADRGETNE